MKKNTIILTGIVIAAMSSLGNIALSLTEDPLWTPYVQQWDRKLHREKNVAKKSTDSITVCRPTLDERSTQR